MPIYYIIFIIVMPALIYVDFNAYKKRMRKNLEEQPDYNSNRKNYDALFDKLEKQQKRTSILVGAVLCIFALVLGISVILTNGQAV